MSPIAISNLLRPHHILPAVAATHKTELLLRLSEFAAQVTAGLTAQDVFTTLQEREELGSTGIGGGIAIPHGRFPQLTEPVLVMGKASPPIEFDAIDELPVDLFFVVLAPTHSSTHLQLLAQLSRLFQDPDFANRLKYCVTAEDIYRCICQRESGLPC